MPEQVGCTRDAEAVEDRVQPGRQVRGVTQRAARADAATRVGEDVDGEHPVVRAEKAVELGWSFFGPLIGSLVDAGEEFTPAELDVVQRYLTAALRAAAPNDAP